MASSSKRSRSSSLSEEEEMVPTRIKRPKTGMEELSISKIKSTLECPVCLMTPRTGRIYQCSNGHMVSINKQLKK